MKCKFCGCVDSKVIDSRTSDDFLTVRRRRECTKCGRRFTTFEEYETIPILVIKSDNSRQPFDREKIRKGIMRACEKRPVAITQIDALVQDIEKELNNTLAQEIESKLIGEMVMSRLRELDQVAYIRFASVYRQFTDISNFLELLDDFSSDQDSAS
ncbi:MAG: transcriptional repressor NrdR [Clostridia bacterium]|nr:transcriptional repressor NrdR [Clostridia bacterium]